MTDMERLRVRAQANHDQWEQDIFAWARKAGLGNVAASLLAHEQAAQVAKEEGDYEAFTTLGLAVYALSILVLRLAEEGDAQ